MSLENKEDIEYLCAEIIDKLEKHILDYVSIYMHEVMCTDTYLKLECNLCLLIDEFVNENISQITRINPNGLKMKETFIKLYDKKFKKFQKEMYEIFGIYPERMRKTYPIENALYINPGYVGYKFLESLNNYF